MSKAKYFYLLVFIVSASCSTSHVKSDIIGTWVAKDGATIEFKEDSCYFTNFDWEYLFCGKNRPTKMDYFFAKKSENLPIIFEDGFLKKSCKYDVEGGGEIIFYFPNFVVVHLADIVDVLWCENYIRFWVDIDLGKTYDFYKQ